MNKLKNYVEYVSDRISVKDLDETNYIGVDNLVPNRGGICTAEYVPEDGYVTKFIVGDILLGNIRPYFKKIWLAEFEGGASPDVLVLRPFHNNDSKFVYAVMSQDSFFDYDMAGSKGSKMPRGDKNHILEYPVIEIKNRDEIGKLINNIDRKIKINNRINDNLQQQLELSFNYYFNNPLTSKSWSSGVLSDIATITMGQSPSGDSYNDNGKGIPFYQGSTDFGSFFPTIRMYTTAPSRMADELDTLLSVRAPVGTMNISFEKCCIGRGLAAIQGNNGNNIFVRYLLKRNQWYFDNINNSGTTFGSITKDHLYKMPITVPDDTSVKAFEDNAKTLEYRIYNNEKEIRTLSSLRNWLLPMLMNGQATISD